MTDDCREHEPNYVRLQRKRGFENPYLWMAVQTLIIITSVALLAFVLFAVGRMV